LSTGTFSLYENGSYPLPSAAAKAFNETYLKRNNPMAILIPDTQLYIEAESTGILSVSYIHL
jgi:hypothetical protein